MRRQLFERFAPKAGLNFATERLKICGECIRQLLRSAAGEGPAVTLSDGHQRQRDSNRAMFFQGQHGMCGVAGE